MACSQTKATTQAHPTSDGPGANQHNSPWIRFSIEYRNRDTNHLIHRQVTKTFSSGIGDDSSSESPAFEVTTLYSTSPMESHEATDRTQPPQVSTAPSYRMRIFSIAIINALKSVVKYYPSQDLTSDIVVINWPYPVLVHHYEELSEFRDACAMKDPGELCIRERKANEHITLLLEFLDDTIMNAVNAEKERLRHDLISWEYAWVRWKPGSTFIHRARTETVSTACVICSVSEGSFESPPRPWRVGIWDLSYDGRFLGRKSSTILFDKFDGTDNASKSFRLVKTTDLEDSSSLDGEVAQRLESGKKYWELLNKQCRNYRGKSSLFPFNEVDGLVMADVKSYYATFDVQDRPQMDHNDCRDTVSDCTCAICKGRKADLDSQQVLPLFDDYNEIAFEYMKELSLHQYLLCSVEIPAFVFSRRKWDWLHVDNFSEPKFEEDMIDSLVMNESRKKIIKGLSKSFARRNRNEEELPREMWAADFVKGKGRGLVFLLHGKPGVGKTCTAECVAAFSRRPLMVLTASDIGTEPNHVESRLASQFKTAESWGAIILIDEADVFMERRSTTDLARNSLVAGFLRALEYYGGIIFLTTNRVGAFDDAFVSRVHIQLYYPDFTDDQRMQVWDTFIKKITKDRRNCIRLNIDAKEYIRGAEVRSIKWNGREIRNAFQTAVALAEYDDEKDEEGNILVTDKHFKAVVDLSKDFKGYLDELHKGNEAKRAERKYERLDSHS